MRAHRPPPLLIALLFCCIGRRRARSARFFSCCAHESTASHTWQESMWPMAHLRRIIRRAERAASLSATHCRYGSRGIRPRGALLEAPSERLCQGASHRAPLTGRPESATRVRSLRVHVARCYLEEADVLRRDPRTSLPPHILVRVSSTRAHCVVCLARKRARKRRRAGGPRGGDT